MKLSNYDNARGWIQSSQTSKSIDIGMYEAASAQVYATLALVDAIREMQQGIRDTVAEEVSSALMDMKDSAHE